MKKLAIMCMALMSVSAFSQDMLSQVKGKKWKLDIQATIKLPEVKKARADKEKKEMVDMTLRMLSAARFEFAKDSVTATVMGKDEVEKVTVVENKKDKLILKSAGGDKTLITKHGNGIKMASMDKTDPNPPLVLVKAN